MKKILFASLGGSLLLAALALPLLGDEKAKPDKEKSATVEQRTQEKAIASPRLQVDFVDGSVMKLTLREEKITFVTPYGKLLIPIADVRRIECATRIPDAAKRKIGAAIEDLGSSEFQKREAASAELLKLGVWAAPALFRAAHSKDAEVVRRAQTLLAKIRATIPAEQLVFREHDILHTDTSKITGRIEGSVFKAMTTQFGAVDMKLADVRNIQVPTATAVVAVPRDAQVLWGNTWWKAEVLEVKGGRYRIHYVGYDSSNDEWVGPDRIQITPAGRPYLSMGTGGRTSGLPMAPGTAEDLPSPPRR
jgi:hypothetical protein